MEDNIDEKKEQEENVQLENEKEGNMVEDTISQETEVKESEEEQQEEKPKKEKKKKEGGKNKKKIIIISVLAVLVVALISLILFFLLNNKEDEEKLEEDFEINSIRATSQGEYVSNNETFIVETSKANEEIVRKHLYVEPPVNYDIKQVNKEKYEVTLNEIPSNSLVNLSLVKDEVKSYSWAFQSTEDLNVLSVYPSDGSSAVPTFSVINISLSYPNVENLEDHFVISPNVEGTFTHIGRVWRFTPSSELQNNTTYTITITSGLKAGNYVLEDSFKSTFSTYNRPQNNSNNNGQNNERRYNHSLISTDAISSFTPNDLLTIKFYGETNVNKIRLYKFDDLNNFMKYLNNDNSYKATDLGDQEYTYQEKYFSYILSNKQEVGYYVAEIYLSSGELFTTVPIQVNPLSAFMFTSYEDLLVWVGTENKLLQNINVSYGDKSVSTNDEGIAIIKKYNDESNKDRYVYVGDSSTPLVVGIRNAEIYDYPTAYIYVDRPIYKNTDTVSIWGYIPLKYYEELFDDFNKNNFVLINENDNIPIQINEDGTFTAKYYLDNHVDGYLSLNLKYKNNYVAYRDATISNYSKQNYEYEFLYDKNYVVAGNSFDFNVHVTHVTGIDVQNKNIVAIYKAKVYTQITDSQGIAHFSIPTSKDANDNTFKYEEVSIKIGDSDYNENNYYITFYKISHSLEFDEKYNYDAKTKTDSVKIIELDPNKNVTNVDYSNYVKLLKSADYNGKVHVELEETHQRRVQDGTYYNSFTQENIPTYRYDLVFKGTVEKKDIDVKDGKIEYTIDYDMKNSTDEDSYSYTLYYTVTKNGDTVNYSSWVYNYNDFNYKEYGMLIESPFRTPIYYSDYDYYRYYFNINNRKEKYSVGDNVNFTLSSFDGSSIGEDNKILRISFKNKILENKIFDSNSNYDVDFNKSSVPGIGYVGAFFKDGKFYRLPSYYFDYNENDSKIDIEITTDKSTYNPGDEVTVTIKTKDKNGNGISSKVNLSVVDKAVFNAVPDYTPILETIYSDFYYYSYTYSSYRDYEIGIGGGGKGDTGGSNPRTKFGDTVYFDEIETDENGNATVKFKLNDSVTTFVATAHAANADVYVGVNKKDIVSSLPLSISVNEPVGLKSTDDAVISANSVGDASENVNYVFELVGTDKKVEVTGKIGSTVYANFGKLDEGTYNVKITATGGDATDAVSFPFVVKTTQQEMAVKATSNVSELKEITPTKNPIVLEFYKSGFSTYMNYLQILVDTNEDRLDTKVAYYKALEYENYYYGNNYPVMITDMEKFNNNGILRYLESDSNSAVVTALVNYYYPGLYKLDKAKYYELLDNTDSANIAIDYLLVLASMKEPVLDELNYLNKLGGDSLFIAKKALAYAFIGDYNSAKELYAKLIRDDNNKGLMAILSTFIDKGNAETFIDELYKEDIADRYVYFAMLSYFANNEAKLSKESTITVKYGDQEEVIKIKGLMMKKLVINNKDLETLSITSDDDKDMVNYYYEGGIKEVSEDNIHEVITMSLDSKNIGVGQLVNLKLDISKLGDNYGSMKVYLPSSLRLSGNVSGRGIGLAANRGEYLVIYISKDHDKVVNIPLYVTYPGNYKIEEVILKNNTDYYISNSLDLDIK